MQGGLAAMSTSNKSTKNQDTALTAPPMPPSLHSIIKNEKPSISRVIKSFQGFSGINFCTWHQLGSLRDLTSNSVFQQFSGSVFEFRLTEPPKHRPPKYRHTTPPGNPQ